MHYFYVFNALDTAGLFETIISSLKAKLFAWTYVV
jgi:hypothetical protein